MRIPLHYQILAAMIAGAVAGLIANPGATALPDATVRLTRGDNGFLLIETGGDGKVQFQQLLSDEAAVRRRYQSAADKLLASTESGETLPVTERGLHFTQEGQAVTLRYMRRYGGVRIMNTLQLKDAAQFKLKYPEFADEYAAYSQMWSRTVTVAAKTTGDLFLRLLRMITVPLIVFSLVTGVAGLGQTKRLGAMFGKTLLYYVCTSVLAIATGILMVNLIKPGIGAELPGGGEGAIVGEGSTLRGIFVGLVEQMIPINPIESLAKGEFLSIITFSILIGLFIIRVGGESAATLKKLFDAGFDVMMAMTLFIIKLAPLGVFGFMVFATASQGLDVFRTFGKYMLTVFIALVFHACVVLPLIVLLVARRSPWKFAQAMSPALLTAFSTASSNGTLPLTMTSAEERARISNRTSSFVLPLGATVNMDGTALYEAVAVLFIAQAYNGFVMPMHQQVVVALTALLASVGAAGIPSAGLVMMAIVLQAVGLPLDAQGLIIAVDRVLDMCRTSVNVWSDACGCAVIDRLEGEGAAA